MAPTQTDEDVTHRKHNILQSVTVLSYLDNRCKVYKVTFGFIFDVGTKYKIDAIRNNYLDEGLASGVHKNSTLRPHNALTFYITSIVNLKQTKLVTCDITTRLNTTI